MVNLKDKFFRRLDLIIYLFLSKIAVLWLKMGQTNDRKTLLLLWAQLKGIDRSNQPPQTSNRSRDMLEYLFDVRRQVDLQINSACARYYSGKHPKHYMWREHNRFIYDHINPDDRVLDIGCGNSYYQQWIAEKAYRVVAIDKNPERIKQAIENNSMPNIQYIVMDASTELPGDTFDVAVCSHVIEHLDDPVDLLRSLSRKIPTLIVKVPLEDTDWMKLVKRDIGIFWMDDRDHRREYNPTMLTNHLNEAGWQVKKMVRGYDLRAIAVSNIKTDRNNR